MMNLVALLNLLNMSEIEVTENEDPNASAQVMVSNKSGEDVVNNLINNDDKEKEIIDWKTKTDGLYYFPQQKTEILFNPSNSHIAM